LRDVTENFVALARLSGVWRDLLAY